MRSPPITLQRIDSTSIRISWQKLPELPDAAISWANSPEPEAEPSGSTQISGRTWVDIADLDPNTRYYFQLTANGQPLARIAERLVPFEGTFNFRDLGGYPTSNGRRVRWGRIFRSDNLTNLTPRDHQLFTRMQIAVVCDFRSRAERERSPNKLPRDLPIEDMHLPMFLGSLDAVEAMERIKQNDLEWLTPEYMLDGYIKNLEESADKWAAVFKRLLEPEPRLVFHCSAGKDRTGICAAFILLALGVPEKAVMKDHALSNEYLQAFLPKVYSYFDSLGLNTQRITPYLTAPREAMRAVLDRIRIQYGGIETYLDHKVGIREEHIRVLRETLLE